MFAMFWLGLLCWLKLWIILSLHVYHNRSLLEKLEIVLCASPDTVERGVTGERVLMKALVPILPSHLLD
jgi:hypothetical protein